jgi:Ca-activated chloride channel family protein
MKDKNNREFEDWYLTAYALGELDQADRLEVEAWLLQHPERLQEIQAIRVTAARVEKELAGLPASLKLDSDRTNTILEAIASASPTESSKSTRRASEVTAQKKVQRKRFLLAIASGLAAGLAGFALWPRVDKRFFGRMENTFIAGNSSIDPVATNTPSPRDGINESLTKSLSGQEFAKGPSSGIPKSATLAQGGPSRGLAPGGYAGGGMGGSGMGGGLGVSGGPASGAVPGFIAESDKSVENLQRESLGEFPEELKNNVPSRRDLQESMNRASGDRFDALPETPFVMATKEPLSTFSIDVDTASYSKLRQYVLENNVVPPASTIRIEEWLNYFDYQYPGPTGEDPFAAHMKLGDCPWNDKHKLVRVAIQAKKIANQERPKSNLVFLIDVSGSMADANKLPLVKQTLGLLTAQLREQDRVAIVVYAGASGCVLPSTSGARKDQILASINELQSGGSTNGGQGIELAYKIAKENFVPGGINRVILCTDGDFNVGVTGTDALVAMMQQQAKSNIFFTCLGYGIGNYNDAMMEQISNKGNGTYAMVDGQSEARRVMTEQLSGTLMTVAKDVKIQIEFNPAKVHSYRLIGYENRRLAAADFNNDKKDAGEIGAGHRVTALYEIVPVGQEDSIPGAVDELRFSKAKEQDSKATAREAQTSTDWLLLKIRSKQPEASQSTKQEFVLGEVSNQIAYEQEQSDYDWAVSVAEFGLLMRQSQLAPGMNWDKMLARALDSTASDPYRQECITIMQRAKNLLDR